MTQGHELERGLHRLDADVVFGTRTRARLLDGLAGEHAERDRHLTAHGQLREGPRDRMGEDLEMRRLAPQEAADRNDRVVTAGPGERCHRRSKLEGARDLEAVNARAGGPRALQSAFFEGPGDVVVPPRAHDCNATATYLRYPPWRGLPRARHLAQSSPRMAQGMTAR